MLFKPADWIGVSSDVSYQYEDTVCIVYIILYYLYMHAAWPCICVYLKLWYLYVHATYRWRLLGLSDTSGPAMPFARWRNSVTWRWESKMMWYHDSKVQNLSLSMFANLICKSWCWKSHTTGGFFSIMYGLTFREKGSQARMRHNDKPSYVLVSSGTSLGKVPHLTSPNKDGWPGFSGTAYPAAKCTLAPRKHGWTELEGADGCCAFGGVEKRVKSRMMMMMVMMTNVPYWFLWRWSNADGTIAINCTFLSVTESLETEWQNVIDDDWLFFFPPLFS